MPKFSCRCGHTVNLSKSDNTEERSLVSNLQIDKIAYELATKNSMTDDVFFELIDVGLVNVIFCSKCGRLYLEQSKGSYVVYTVEK